MIFAFLVWRHGYSLSYFSLPWACGYVDKLGIRLPESIRINSTLCMISIVLAVYSTELILAYSGSSITAFGAQAWLSFPQDANVQVAAEADEDSAEVRPEVDVRTRLEVVSAMRARGVKAYPDVFPMVLFAPSSGTTIQSVLTSNNEEFLPVGGMSTTTTVFCNESGEYIVYESDEHGFHDPRGMSGKKTG